MNDVAEKVGQVTISDPLVAKVKKKGKKIVVTGLGEGITTVTAYDKKGRLLRNLVVQVR